MFRAFVASTLVVLFAGAGITEGDKKVDKKDDNAIVWNMDYLEKTYGIKVKSTKIDKIANKMLAKVVMEFTKDVENLDEMRKCFRSTGKPPKTSVWFYMFDEDNIVIGKTTSLGTEGELTGMKGDAFRLHIELDSGRPDRIRKIEVRPVIEDKKKS